jgi:hypothetical protein
MPIGVVDPTSPFQPAVVRQAGRYVLFDSTAKNLVPGASGVFAMTPKTPKNPNGRKLRVSTQHERAKRYLTKFSDFLVRMTINDP